MRIVRLFALLLLFLSITSSAFTQNKKQKTTFPGAMENFWFLKKDDT